MSSFTAVAKQAVEEEDNAHTVFTHYIPRPPARVMHHHHQYLYPAAQLSPVSFRCPLEGVPETTSYPMVHTQRSTEAGDTFDAHLRPPILNM